MALGKVEITTQAITDTPTAGVIGKVLFIGAFGSSGSATVGAVETLSASFDADAKFHKDSLLAKSIKAGFANNPKMQGWAIAHAASGKTWADVIDSALQTAEPEIIALVEEQANKTALQAIQTKAATLEGLGKRVIFLASVKGTDTSKTLTASIAAAKTKIANLAASRLAVFPLNFGQEIGVMGRQNQQNACPSTTDAGQVWKTCITRQSHQRLWRYNSNYH